jgi:hypothetical protein
VVVVLLSKVVTLKTKTQPRLLQSTYNTFCLSVSLSLNQYVYVSEVGDRFASSVVPNVNHCVPDATGRVLSNGIFSL